MVAPPPPPRQEMAEQLNGGRSKDLEGQGTVINHVALRNFKGHANLDLDMGRITVLIGPTGSGKSTVLQAVNLLRSALGSKGHPLQGNGSYDHSQFTDIVTCGDERREVSIAVDGQKKVKAGGKHAASTKFSCRLTLGRSPSQAKLDATVDIRCGPHPDDAITMRLDHSHSAGRTVVSGAGTPGGGQVVACEGGTGLVPRMQARLAEGPAAEVFSAMFHEGEYFRSLLEDLWHVPFSRVVTRDSLPLEYSTGIMSQNRAQAAASLLSHISGDSYVQKKMSGMIKEVGLRRIATRTIPARKGEKDMITLDFIGKETSNTIVHEGSGLNQLASMFAILSYSPRESVVTVEEPEIHLDPAAQARLTGIMVRQVVEEGKQIVFTTHSDYLLYPLLAYIKKKDCPLTCSDVAMHYFDTDESGAVAGAEKLDINEHGQIHGGLRGFWDAGMKAMNEVLE